MGISFLLCLSHLFSQLFVRPFQTTILPFCISFSWGWSWLLSPIQCHEPLSIVHQALCLPGTLSLKSISHFHCIVIKDLILVIPEWSNGFPYFLQFKSEFGNKEFMIWATVSSQSCFYWLYTVSPSLGYKEYNQSASSIDHLVMSMCRVFSCVVGRGCLLRPVRSLGKTLLAFALLLSVLPRPNLPVIPGVS